MRWQPDEILSLRQSLGLNQTEFAEKLGVSRVMVWYWESGKKSPSKDSQAKLAKLALESESVNRESVNRESVNRESVNRDKVTEKENVDKTEQPKQHKKDASKKDTSSPISPIEYFETAYREASGYIVLTTITQPKSDDRRGKLSVKGTYKTDSISNLLSDVNELNGKVHIYTNIHPLREPPQQGRGKESDILGVSLFATDTDAKDFISDPKELKKAISQKAFYEWTDELLYECKAKALEHIKSVTSKVGVPPSAIIDSGHGYYPIFFLEKFIEFESDRHREELKALNKILHSALSADATFDFARILRVPSTQNIKPGYPAECKLIEFHPERRYTVKDIRRFEISFTSSKDKDKDLKSETEAEKESSSDKGSEPSKDGKIDLTQFNLKDETIHIIETGDASDYKSRSERDHSVVCRLVLAGATDKDISTIFRQYPVGDKYLESGNGERYLKLSIEKARKWKREKKDKKKNQKEYDKYFIGKAFSPATLADELGNEYDFIFSGETIHVYKHGVFVPLGKELIAEETRKRLSPLARTYHVSETLNHIRDMNRVSESELNRYRHLVNLKNGMFDLFLGELIEHDPKYLSTIQIKLEYKDDADATQSFWDFIGDTLGKNSFRTFLQLCGYCLLLDQRYKKAFFFVGPTDTGKTQLLQLLFNFVGEDYVVSTPMNLLEESRWYRARLFGKLIGFCDDLPFMELKESSVFKRITGGVKIDAERKHQQHFDFKPFAKLIFATNEMPDARVQSQAFFNRLIIFPCRNKVPKEKQVPHIADKLSVKENLEGLLAAALVSLTALLKRERFDISDETRKATESYEMSQNSVIAFVRECCYRDPSACVRKDKLYSAYVDFCDEYDIQPKFKNTFFKKLHSNFSFQTTQKTGNGKRIRVMKGIGLRLENQ